MVNCKQVQRTKVRHILLLVYRRKLDGESSLWNKVSLEKNKNFKLWWFLVGCKWSLVQGGIFILNKQTKKKDKIPKRLMSFFVPEETHISYLPFSCWLWRMQSSMYVRAFLSEFLYCTKKWDVLYFHIPPLWSRSFLKSIIDQGSGFPI